MRSCGRLCGMVRRSTRVERMLLACCAAFAVAWWLPADFTLRPAEIGDKYLHKRLLLPFTPSPDAATPFELATIAAAAVPIGLAAVLCGGGSQHAAGRSRAARSSRRLGLVGLEMIADSDLFAHDRRDRAARRARRVDRRARRRLRGPGDGLSASTGGCCGLAAAVVLSVGDGARVRVVAVPVRRRRAARACSRRCCGRARRSGGRRASSDVFPAPCSRRSPACSCARASIPVSCGSRRCWWSGSPARCLSVCEVGRVLLVGGRPTLHVGAPQTVGAGVRPVHRIGHDADRLHRREAR